MSTPNEGPGLRPWTQGDARDAAQALSQLNPREQQALGRVIKVAAAVGPIINNVARGINVIRNTMTRLSELAQRLYSSGVNRAAQVKERTSDKAGELSQQGKDAVSAARSTATNVKDWAVGLPGRAAEAGRQGLAAGQELAGRAAEAGRQGLAAGQAAAGQVVAAGQAAAGRAGRWFNQQVSRGAAKASAALAGLAARRSDPTLTSPDQKLQKRDVLLAQKAAELFTSPDNQRAAKAAELAAFIQNAYGNDQKVSLEKPGGPEQSVDAGARTTAATHEMAWVLNGTAPANEIHSGGTPATPDAASNGEQTGRHAKKEGPTQSGPSRD
jgi:hypothetical protein